MPPLKPVPWARRDTFSPVFPRGTTSLPAKLTVRLASRGSFASLYCVPLSVRLQQVAPNLVLEVHSAPAERANAELLSGKLDMAIIDDPIPNDALRIERLTEVTYSVYCGRGRQSVLPIPPRDERIR